MNEYLSRSTIGITTCWDPWILWPHESNHLSVKFMKSIIYQTTRCTFERVIKLHFWDDVQRTLRGCSKNIKRIKKSKNQNIKEHHLRIEVLRLFQKCILWSDKWYFRSQITSLITLRTWKGPWVSASGCINKTWVYLKRNVNVVVSSCVLRC